MTIRWMFKTRKNKTVWINKRESIFKIIYHFTISLFIKFKISSLKLFLIDIVINFLGLLIKILVKTFDKALSILSKG